MNSITWFIEYDTGTVHSIYKEEYICTVLDYKHMQPSNNFEMKHFLEKGKLDFQTRHTLYTTCKTTKKIPLKIKNAHRKMYNLKPVKKSKYSK